MALQVPGDRTTVGGGGLLRRTAGVCGDSYTGGREEVIAAVLERAEDRILEQTQSTSTAAHKVPVGYWKAIFPYANASFLKEAQGSLLGSGTNTSVGFIVWLLFLHDWKYL